jgi:hypothetical protein
MNVLIDVRDASAIEPCRWLPSNVKGRLSWMRRSGMDVQIVVLYLSRLAVL